MDGTGAQTIDGGVGTDTLIVDLGKYSADEFEWDVNLTEGRANVKGELDNPARDTIINIENVDIAGDINITLVGNNNDNQLYTGTGDDRPCI